MNVLPVSPGGFNDAMAAASSSDGGINSGALSNHVIGLAAPVAFLADCVETPFPCDVLAALAFLVPPEC